MLFYILDYVASRSIIGGGITTRCKIPYIVQLKTMNGHHCGGSILSNRTIITAKHCMNITDFVYIRIDDQFIYDYSVIMHPTVDIALIIMDEVLIFSKKIQPISLYSANSEPQHKTPVLVAGYGRTENFRYTGLLKFNILYSQRIINNTIILLQHRIGSGVCFGDSGGPAVINNKLVGVASFVQITCGTHLPDGFVYLPSFFNFINKYLV